MVFHWTRHKEKYNELRLDRVSITDIPADQDATISYSDETHIDCTFLGDTSNEYYSTSGLLVKKPAAMVFLNLQFPQYRKSEVDFVDITLTFRDAETGKATTITGNFGPVELCGQEIRRDGTRSWKVMPEIGVEGIASIGGVGMEGSGDATVLARWTFKSQRLPDERRRYSKLKWEWKANQLQKEKSKIVHVGFIVNHSSPTLITETVVHGKFTGKWLRRSFESEPTPTVMRLRLNASDTDFTERSKTLRGEMERKNGAEQTVEIDDVRKPEQQEASTPSNE
jgi:hypothetical protein